MSISCEHRRPCMAPAKQRGEMLLEALVAVLVTSIIAAGLAHMQARVMDSQRATKLERLVVVQLRDQMQTAGTSLCGAGTLALPLAPDLERTATVACGPGPTLEVGVAGAEREVDAPRRIDLSVASADLDPAVGGQNDAHAVDLLVSSNQ